MPYIGQESIVKHNNPHKLKLIKLHVLAHVV